MARNTSSSLAQNAQCGVTDEAADHFPDGVGDGGAQPRADAFERRAELVKTLSEYLAGRTKEFTDRGHGVLSLLLVRCWLED